MMSGCKRYFSALPVFTYRNLRSGPVLEKHRFVRTQPASTHSRRAGRANRNAGQVAGVCSFRTGYQLRRQS
ncbi:MAG: hypothetical protein EOP21_02250 [Hyphomicrobiales bacterium]|nr:MAG: hypothetical protein EOP21_02250 [Hyphomicrobiales bacterium]